MSGQAKTVLFSTENGLARLTLNRPEKRNALNDAMIAELEIALRTANNDQTVRAVILTGAGADFCSGADLQSLQKISNASVAENLSDARMLFELFTLIRAVRMPVIAAVRGRAPAGGCGLASACDLIVASTNARFGYPEVKIGFVPAMVLAILRRNISEKHAFELLTRGSEIGAEEAERLGLVNRVFSDETFESDMTTYAEEFQKLSASAVSLTKSLLYQTDGLPFVDALETGLDVNVIARMTADCQKGIARFLSKT